MSLEKQAYKPARLLGKIILKQNENDSFVLVEGKEDRAIWSKFSAGCCVLIPAGGKCNVIDTLEHIMEEQPSWRNICAVVDPDLWLVVGSAILSMRNLLYDDSPDLEVTLVRSGALESFVVQTLTFVEPDKLCEIVAEAKRLASILATEYGYFRLIHSRHPEFGLSSFAKIVNQMSRYIDGLTLDVDCVVDKLREGSSKRLSRRRLLELYESCRADYPAPDWRLCRGKDLFAILSVVLLRLMQENMDNEGGVVYLRRECGIESVRDKRGSFIEKNRLCLELRKCYDSDDFRATALYRRIREWEAAHSPFRIIRDYPLERTTP